MSTFKPKRTGSYEIWRGASAIDGAPIVVLATMKSANRKTGNVIQTYILRADMSPTDALASGADESICGDCPLRGAKCYVNVGQSPLSVWRAWKRGQCERVEASQLGTLGFKRIVRLGAYGDPAAVPVHIWRLLISRADGWTGYTHQWKRFPEFKALCMASTDSADGLALAQSEGWRAFHVVGPHDETPRGMLHCPADKLGEHKIQCEQCKYCDGSGSHRARARSVWIPAHGGAATMNVWRASAPTSQALTIGESG